MASSRPLVVAHRGFHLSSPENTIAAFEAAVSLGVDMIELDVQETADGALVVHHDECVSDTPIAELALDTLLRLSPPPSCPLLEDVVSAVGEDVFLDIEVKRASAGRLAAVVGASPRCVFSSFDPQTLRELEQVAPTVSRGLVVGADGDTEDVAPAALVERTVAAAAQFLVLDRRLADEATLAGVARHLEPSYVWGAESEPELRRLLVDGNVGAVITDRPDLALELRSG